MPRVSIVVPVYNEGPTIVDFLDRVFEAVTLSCEVLAVYNAPGDSTVPYLEEYAHREGRLRPLHNTYGRGPAAALRFGVDHAESEVVAVKWPTGAIIPTGSISSPAWSSAGWWSPVPPSHARRPSRNALIT